MITCLNPQDFLMFLVIVGEPAIMLTDTQTLVGPLLWIFDGWEWCTNPGQLA